MSLKFRKRIKILPGVTLNLSKSGLSTTIGKKGLSLNIGQNGTYLNTGLPGTGIYDRQHISGPGQNPATNTDQLPPDGTEPQKNRPGCLAIILFIIGILSLALAVYSQVTQAEAGTFIGLFFGILFMTPFLRFYIRRHSKRPATEFSGSGCLSGLLYTFGMMSTGFGLDMYKTDDFAFKLLLAGLLMLLLALLFHLISRRRRNNSADPTNPDTPASF